MFTFIVINNGMDATVLTPDVHEIPGWDYIPLPTPTPGGDFSVLLRGF